MSGTNKMLCIKGVAKTNPYEFTKSVPLPDDIAYLKMIYTFHIIVQNISLVYPYPGFSLELYH